MSEHTIDTPVASASPSSPVVILSVSSGPGGFARFWPAFREVVRAGDTYAYAPDTDEATACALWTTAPAQCFLAFNESEVDSVTAPALGGYTLRPNQPGLGDHVANAGFMVSPHARRRGIATLLARHALATAREQGFLGMQFNFVVSSNRTAVDLWQRTGFQIVGRVPRAFRHATNGLTDILIMYMDLTDANVDENKQDSPAGVVAASTAIEPARA